MRDWNRLANIFLSGNMPFVHSLFGAQTLGKYEKSEKENLLQKWKSFHKITGWISVDWQQEWYKSMMKVINENIDWTKIDQNINFTISSA